MSTSPASVTLGARLHRQGVAGSSPLGEESNMQRNRAHIMIADDHTFVAEACKKLLEPEFNVVATVGDGLPGPGGKIMLW
jgi:PleD family two-component response regulator